MANKHRGEVAIKLDKIRKLKFTTNALAELEDVLGVPLSKLDTLDMGIRTIIKMFWASLLHDDPEITLKEAGELMDYSSLTEISDKVREALELSLGSSEQKEKN